MSKITFIHFYIILLFGSQPIFTKIITRHKAHLKHEVGSDQWVVHCFTFGSCLLLSPTFTSDLMLSSLFQHLKNFMCVVSYILGVVYSFNVTNSPSIRAMAGEKSVPLEEHNVIYRLFSNIQERLTQLLPPVLVENILGVCIKLLTTHP